MTMKRILCLLLVLVMVVAVVASCGGGKQPEKPKDDDDVIDDGEGPDEGTEDEPHWTDEVKFAKGTTIKIQLSDLPDAELTTGCRRYMAGPGEEFSNGAGFEKVQNEVFKRNKNAMDTLGLDVEYSYIVGYWGSGEGPSASSLISKTEQSGVTPDMYCDMMYEMAGLSLQHETFTNILRYTYNRSNTDGWKEGNGYFDIQDELGYNTDLMKDMALSEDKQFLIASDYYVDVMRAMLVMPFNLDMYNDSVKLPGQSEIDTDATGLYTLVEEGGWTWDVLLGFSTAVYNGSSKADITKDDKMLMALSVSGLSATGIIYSTAFTTYDEGLYDRTGEIVLESSCAGLVNAFGVAESLAKENAIACGEATRGQPAGVEKCKEVFTEGRALFAGPQMLGVVEEDAYTNMEDRVSIVPIPKQNPRANYNTAINTRARVGALSYHSTKQAETSAWIQYSTEQSETVRKEYFENAMNSKFLAPGASGMLTLIYGSVGDSKSSVIDHMLLFKAWDEMHKYTWTQMITEGDFTKNAGNINTVYSTAVDAKREVLAEVLAAWEQADAYNKN